MTTPATNLGIRASILWTGDRFLPEGALDRRIETRAAAGAGRPAAG